MTALCGGGTSGPQVGASAVVDFGVGALSVALSQYGAGWALAAIPFVGLAPLTLTTFCSTDPPAIPTFTSAESQAILSVNLSSDFFSGIGKLNSLLQHLIWYQVCQCTSGTLTALPAAPAPPAGTPITQNAPTPSPSITLCQSLLHRTGGTTVEPSSGATAIGYETSWPAAATSLVAVFKDVVNGAGPHPTVCFYVELYDSTSTVYYTSPYACAPSGTNAAPLTVPLDARAFQIGFRIYPSSSTDQVGVDQDYYGAGCTPGGSLLQPQACQPDPNSIAELNAILAMVTLIQRQIVPFAYAYGTIHAALSGSGAFAVQGILGLKVQLTTVPPSVGSEAGDPAQIFDAGWINAGTSDGFGPRQWISSNPFLLRPVAPDVTEIGYSLKPGVIATITELKREP